MASSAMGEESAVVSAQTGGDGTRGRTAPDWLGRVRPRWFARSNAAVVGPPCADPRHADPRYEAFAELSKDLVVATDAALAIRYASPGFSSLRQDPTAMIGQCFLDLARPSEHDRLAASIEEMLRSPGRQPPVELWLRGGDDSALRVEVVCHNLLGSPALDAVVFRLRDVTARYWAHKQAIASGERHRTIVDTAHEGILMVTPEGVTVFANQRFASMLGYSSPADVEGCNVASLLFEEDRGASGTSLDGPPAKPEQVTHRFRRADGSDRQAMVSSSPIYDEEGAYAGTLVMVSDVTRLQRATEAVRRSREYYRVLFESNLLPLWLYDPDTLAFVAVNDAAVSAYGYSRQEFEQMTILDIRPPESQSLVREAVTRPRPPGLGPSAIWTHRRKDGTLFEVEIRTHDILVAGRPARLVTATDVTERLAAEVRLVQSEERFRLLAENAQDVIFRWRTTPEFGFDFVGPNSTELFGYTPEELYAEPMLARDIFSVEAWEAIDGLEKVLNHEPVEIQITHRDGSKVWSEVLISLVSDEEGQVLAMEGIARNTTERHEAMEALERSEERFRSLVQGAYDVVIVVDTDARISYVSPSIERVLGHSAGALLGTNCFVWLHPDDADDARTQFATVLMESERDRSTVEYRLRKADGSFAWVEIGLSNLLANPAVSGVVINFRDVTERREASEAQRYQSTHDALTGLGNRTLLSEHLQHGLQSRAGSGLALLLMDLDAFKEINEGLGHEVGDSVIAEIGRRLAAGARPSDLVVRIGGDEFAMLLDGADRVAATLVASRMTSVVQEPIRVAGLELVVGASVGVVLCPEHGTDADALLRRADVAMYQAKASGGGWALYSPAHDTSGPERLALIQALRRAVDAGSIEVEYQPLVDLATNRPVGVEALARWSHPELGTIGPADFIPLAEHTGIIRPLTQLVLSRAIGQCARWRAEGIEVGVSVNLSPTALADPRLPEQIRAKLTAVGVPPGSLTLEVTESAFAEDDPVGMAVLHRLASMGIRLSIDDFGTGYSAMAYLKDLPVCEFKIDRAFVLPVAEDPREAALVEALVALGRARGLTVVAEGIETEDVAAVLANMGCALGQGFWFKRPAPAAEITAWLSRSYELESGITS